MPLFSLLIHDHPALHWDLLLEDGPVLRAWRLLAEPQAGVIIPAEAIPDHRLLYLDYEGPISGNRGRVLRWDRGEYAGTLATKPILLQLTGTRLRGRATLSQSADESWQFEYQPESPSQSSP